MDQPSRPPINFKRGIPGVSSDAYHFGYFEDVTSHRSLPLIHTKFDPLFDTLYIFGALLLGFFLVTCIAFGIREYTWSLKRRNRLFSSGSVWSNHSQISMDGATLSPIGGFISGVPLPNQEFHEPRRNEPTSGNTENESFIAASNQGDDMLKVLENSGSNNSSGSESMVHVSNKIKLSALIDSKIYGIRELLSLRPAEYHGIPIMKTRELDPEDYMTKSLTFKMSYPISHVDFRSPWNAEKAITEIHVLISTLDNTVSRSTPIIDNTTKLISVYRLLAIGANPSSFTNPNVFLPSFNKAMDYLIDTGAMFDILNEVNVYFARSIVEMVLQYCLAHWTFKKNNEVILKRFSQWQIDPPVSQAHHIIFRYLLNLQLGLHTIDRLDQDSLQFLQIRLKLLLRSFAGESTHKDLKMFFPVLAQAVEFSEKQEITATFYDVFEILIKAHAACCVRDIFKSSNKDLKMLCDISHLETRSTDVKNTIERIHRISVKLEPELERWWKEIKSRQSVAGKPSPVKREVEVQDDGRVVTPGSWKR